MTLTLSFRMNAASVMPVVRLILAGFAVYDSGMAYLLGGISSFACWRDPALSVKLAVDRPRFPLRLASVNPEDDILDILASAGVPSVDRFDLLVPRGSRRFRRASLSTVGFDPDVPAFFYRRLSTKVAALSPEACFFFLARRYPIIHLAALGCELCGSFGVSGKDGELFSRNPLTTCSKLRRFIENQNGSYGVKRARQAARFVTDGSASPQETRLYLLLCLPRRMGGYGFPQPQLNRVVHARPLGGRIVGKRRYCCDLYWPQARFGIEYDSEDWHTGYEAVDRDSKRRASLEASGVSVLTVTKGQIANLSEMERVARLVARHLEIRPRRGLFDLTPERKALHASRQLRAPQ